MSKEPNAFSGDVRPPWGFMTLVIVIGMVAIADRFPVILHALRSCN